MLPKNFSLVYILFTICKEGLTENIFSLDAHVRVLKTAQGQTLVLACKSTSPTILCEVEFLLNNRTLGTLRRVEDVCYHGRGACSPEVCNCLSDCKTFHLNYTDSENMTNFTFGCSARFRERMQIPHRTELLLLYNGTGYYTLQKIDTNTNNATFPSYRNTTEEISTIPNISKTQNTACAIMIWMIPAVSALVFLIFFAIWIFVCSRKKKNTSKGNTGFELENLLQKNDITAKCCSCFAIAVCAICVDCEKRFCERCQKHHEKMNGTHVMCNLKNVFLSTSSHWCKECTMEKSTMICYACSKVLCNKCVTKHHHKHSMIVPMCNSAEHETSKVLNFQF